MTVARSEASVIRGWESDTGEETIRATRAIHTVALVAGLVIGAGIDGLRAQQSSDSEDVRTAMRAFYAALSARDAGAIKDLWAREP